MDENSCLLKSDFEIFHEDYKELKSLQKNHNFEQAKIIIDQMILRLENYKKVKSEEITSKTDPLFLRFLAMKHTLLYELSKILVSLGEDSAAIEILETAFDLIQDTLTKSEIIYLALRIMNHYSYLLIKKNDFKKAREILELSEKTYEELKKQNAIIPFCTSDEIFSIKSETLPISMENGKKLERLVTNNLQMLSFVYNKQELHELFADYHHKILQRNLDMKDENFGLWAHRSSRLALYFIREKRFQEARHHLAAAVYILEKYENELKLLEPSQDLILKLEDVQYKYADVAKCWVKYCLSLFHDSKTNSVSKFCGESTETLEKIWDSPLEKKMDPENVTKSSDETNDIHKNKSFDKNFTKTKITKDSTESPRLFKSIDFSEYENRVTATLVENTSEARELFNFTHLWLKKAKVFYNLQDHPMEYVNDVLDLSELYRYLAFYEEDIESQYAVHKLRAEALETLSSILKEVRPECYIAVSIELLRELAEVQLEMMGLNLRRICMAQEISPQTGERTLQKMEALADIHSKLEHFGDSLDHKVENVDLLSNKIDSDVNSFIEDT